MKSRTIENAVVETLKAHTNADGYSFFNDTNEIGVVEAGFRDKMTEETAKTEGFFIEELPAVRVWCDAAPGAQDYSTTNEHDITRQVIIDVMTAGFTADEAADAADAIREEAAIVMRKQVTLCDGAMLQRDLLSQKAADLGGVRMIARNVTELPYAARKLDETRWFVIMQLQVSIFYIQPF